MHSWTHWTCCISRSSILLEIDYFVWLIPELLIDETAVDKSIDDVLHILKQVIILRDQYFAKIPVVTLEIMESEALNLWIYGNHILFYFASIFIWDVFQACVGFSHFLILANWAVREYFWAFSLQKEFLMESVCILKSSNTFQIINFWLICHLRVIFAQNYVIDSFRSQGYEELGALCRLTLNTYLTSHLLDELFANAQSEASSLGVHFLMFIQLIEIHKELLQIVLRNANAAILKNDLHFKILILRNNMIKDVSFMSF